MLSAFVRRRESGVMLSALHNFIIASTEGLDSSASHREMEDFDSPAFFAKASCDKPVFSLKNIRFLLRVLIGLSKSFS